MPNYKKSLLNGSDFFLLVDYSSVVSSIAERSASSTFCFFFLGVDLVRTMSISYPVSLEAKRTFWPCLPIAIDY